jgi:hypothetical protein
MDQEEVKTNINIAISEWHKNSHGCPVKPIVCILCDRFILHGSNKVLSIQTITAYQELFYPNAIFKLSPEIISSYRISIPANINVPRGLDISNCLFSQRSSYVTNNLRENGYNICNICCTSIGKGILPKFSIANNYCFGSPPQCLTALTEVERAAITPVKTFGY